MPNEDRLQPKLEKNQQQQESTQKISIADNNQIDTNSTLTSEDFQKHPISGLSFSRYE